MKPERLLHDGSDFAKFYIPDEIGEKFGLLSRAANQCPLSELEPARFQFRNGSGDSARGEVAPTGFQSIACVASTVVKPAKERSLSDPKAVS